MGGCQRGEYAGYLKILKVEHAPTLEQSSRARKVDIVNDWLLLTLEQPLGQRFGTLKPALRPLRPGMALKTAGYGMDRRHLLIGDLDGTVIIAPAPGKPLAIAHNCETTHGNSGGPLWWNRTARFGWPASSPAAPRSRPDNGSATAAIFPSCATVLPG